jgi:hypothetical protein
MATTLISISKLDVAGFRAKFGNGTCTIIAPDQRIIAQIPAAGGLYTIGNLTERMSEHANAAAQRISLTQAHRIMGHISYGAVRDAIRSGHITGIELEDGDEGEFCEACAQAKPHRKPFPKQARNRSEHFGERVHADLWGPASVESLGRKKYSVDFTDDATRWTDIDFLAQKDHALRSYKTLDKRFETQEGSPIKILRSDRGGEFKSDEFDQYLKSRGTRRELTVHDTHEQVGVAERLNRTKVELARAMLFDSKLPKYLWAEAMHHAIWIKNRSPTRALDGKTPYEARFRKKPNLANVAPFGTQVWVKIHDAGKLEPRARPGYFVGYDDESTGYRIYFPDTRKVNPEREVIFNLTKADDTVLVDGPEEPQPEAERTIAPQRQMADGHDGPDVNKSQPADQPDGP